MRLTTTRGYVLSDVVSALQKAIRRGDARVAGYFGIEMFESGYAAYAWRRLLTISAEDCAGLITREIYALYRTWKLLDTASKGRGRVVLAKAVILLCQAQKSRDADHLTNLIYDPRRVSDVALEQALAEARQEELEMPDYTFDCHTERGKRDGKTKREFFLEEFEALTPRAVGLFDDDIAALRRGDVTLTAKRAPRRKERN